MIMLSPAPRRYDCRYCRIAEAGIPVRRYDNTVKNASPAYLAARKYPSLIYKAPMGA
jgi:hypothetical protein